MGDTNVLVAVANENQKKIINEAFPKVETIAINGYNIKYSKSKRWLWLKILLQIPKILWVIYFENKWLKNVIKDYNIKAVFSDNRYGLFNKKTKCIFLTHQLKIIIGGVKFLELLAQKINYFFINKYDECWVVDLKGENSIAKELSNPPYLPKIETNYVGILSRLQK